MYLFDVRAKLWNDMEEEGLTSKVRGLGSAFVYCLPLFFVHLVSGCIPTSPTRPLKHYPSSLHQSPRSKPKTNVYSDLNEEAKSSNFSSPANDSSEPREWEPRPSKPSKTETSKSYHNDSTRPGITGSPTFGTGVYHVSCGGDTEFLFGMDQMVK